MTRVCDLRDGPLPLEPDIARSIPVTSFLSIAGTPRTVHPPPSFRPLSSITNHHHYPNSKTSRNEAKSTFLFLSVFLFQLFCVSRFSGRSGEFWIRYDCDCGSIVSVKGMKRGGDIGNIGGMQPLFDLCSSAIDVGEGVVAVQDGLF